MIYAQFIQRVDVTLLAQLTSEGGPDAVPNQTLCEVALLDAERVIQGYVERLTAALRPSDDVLEPHRVAVTLQLLANNRPGQQFPTIRDAYKDTIAFLKGLGSKEELEGGGGGGTSGLSLGHTAPAPLFDADSLDSFGQFGGGSL